MKRKTLTLTLSLLACFALIGVGFASWLITKTNEQNTEGNFIVETVTESKLNVSLMWQEPDGDNWKDLGKDVKPQVSYTPLVAANSGPSWLKASNSVNESLRFNLVVKVTKDDNSAFATSAPSDVSALLTVVANVSGNDEYTTAKNNGYVGELPSFVEDADNAVSENYEINVALTEITITYGFEFKWGSAFGEVNPMTYYKQEEGLIGQSDHFDTLDSLQNDAKTKLSNLYTQLSGQKFTLNLKITLA